MGTAYMGMMKHPNREVSDTWSKSVRNESYSNTNTNNSKNYYLFNIEQKDEPDGCPRMYFDSERVILSDEDANMVTEECNNIIFDLDIYNTDVRSARFFNNLLNNMTEHGDTFASAYFKRDEKFKKPILNINLSNGTRLTLHIEYDRILNVAEIFRDSLQYNKNNIETFNRVKYYSMNLI